MSVDNSKSILLFMEIFMSKTDPLQQIKQAEKAAEDKVAKAKAQSQDLILKTKIKAEQDLKDLSRVLEPEIKMIFTKKEKDIFLAREKEEKRRVAELKNTFDNFPRERINKAVEYVLKQII